MWRVVFCSPKGCEATEAARHGRLHVAHLVEHLYFGTDGSGFNSHHQIKRKVCLGCM